MSIMWKYYVHKIREVHVAHLRIVYQSDENSVLVMKNLVLLMCNVNNMEKMTKTYGVVMVVVGVHSTCRVAQVH